MTEEKPSPAIYPQIRNAILAIYDARIKLKDQLEQDAEIEALAAMMRTIDAEYIRTVLKNRAEA